MMKNNNLFTFLLTTIILICGTIHTNHGSVYIPTNTFGEDSMLRYSELTSLDEGNLNSIIESEYFQKTFLPFYLEDLIETLATTTEDLFKGVESRDCIGNILQLFELLKNNNFSTLGRLHTWALHILDAWAKPPEGILSGHINPTGDYDECVGLKAKNTTNKLGKVKDFNGKYCTVYIYPKPETRNLNNNNNNNNNIETKLLSKDIVSSEFHHISSKFEPYRNFFKNINDTISTKQSVAPSELVELMSILTGAIVLPTMGVCFPETCSTNDIKMILENGFKILNISKNIAAPTVDMCYVQKKPDFDAGDISVIALLGVLGSLCLSSGIIDILLNRGVEKPPRRGLLYQYFMAFSFYTNINKWLSTRTSGDDLGCVHGIRFLSTCWVICAHTWYVVTFLPVWNMVDFKLVHEDWPIMLVINSTVSVDTFFVLSGMLVCYAVMKTLDKQKGSLNIPMFYIHRYLRLTPTYAIMIGMMATIFPYFGSGPFWKIMDRWSNICENNWWTNMLYVNNFVNTSFLCQGEAWYLANDFQFYVLSPIIIYPLWKWSSIGIGLLIVSTVLSILCPGLLVYFYQIVPTTIGTREMQKWFLDVYIKPWARIQTYLVGVAVGYMLFKTKGKKIHISKLIQLICWTISTGTALAVLFGMYPYFDPAKEIPRVTSFFFASFNRFGWGVSIGWIIFACVKGYGGLINSFLCWKPFMPLGRLCFCAFLISLHLQMIFHLRFRQPITFDPYSMVNFFFAHLIMSFAAGFICTITMESPFIQISKLMFEGGDRGGKTVNLSQGVAPARGNERYGIYYNNGDTVINTEHKGK